MEDHYKKRRRIEAKRKGFCTLCFHSMAAPNRTQCSRCLEHKSKWHKSSAGQDRRKRYEDSHKGRFAEREKTEERKAWQKVYQATYRNRNKI